MSVGRSAISYLLSDEAKQSSLVPLVETVLAMPSSLGAGAGPNRAARTFRDDPLTGELLDVFDELTEFNKARLLERARMMLETQKSMPLSRNSPSAKSDQDETLGAFREISEWAISLIHFAEAILRTRMDLIDEHRRSIDEARQAVHHAWMGCHQGKGMERLNDSQLRALVRQLVRSMAALEAALAEARSPMPSDWTPLSK